MIKEQKSGWPVVRVSHKKKHARNGYFLQRSDTSDVGNVDEMANDTVAIFYHYSSTETKKSQRQLCPKGRIYMVKIQ